MNSPQALVVRPTLAWLDKRTLAYYRDLVLVLLGKEFKIRYKSTLLGYGWSVMHPLASALILFVLFRVVMRFELQAYWLYLIGGLFAWQWIANTVASANFYFLGNSTLIKKVRFQRAALVLAGVLNDLVHFLVSIPVVIGIMAYYHKWPRIEWLWMLPALVAVQLVMTFGLGLFVATANLFFRDLERLSGILMNLLFYLTPIVFTWDRVPAEYQWLLYVNPFAPLVACWHGLFYYDAVPMACLAGACAWSAAFFALGWLVYSRCVWRFAELV